MFGEKWNVLAFVRPDDAKIVNKKLHLCFKELEIIEKFAFQIIADCRIRSFLLSEARRQRSVLFLSIKQRKKALLDIDKDTYRT